MTVYFVTNSIRQVIVATLAGWLLLQVAYFASVLFLIWRSSCVREMPKGLSISVNAGQFAIGRNSIIKE
ncbi:exopolysaccharide production repressor protein [Sinorhizobium prairiense]